jgi:hypothetical protein
MKFNFINRSRPEFPDYSAIVMAGSDFRAGLQEVLYIKERNEYE